MAVISSFNSKPSAGYWTNIARMGLMKPNRVCRGTALGFLLAIFACTFNATFIWAIPQIPHQLFGNAMTGGIAASPGKSVVAKIGGITYASTLTDAQGRYGYNPIFMVPADDLDTPAKEGGVAGEIIELYLDNTLSATATFQYGGIQQVNLAAPGPLPTITTNTPTSIIANSATLNADLTSLGTALTVNVYFEWGTSAVGPFTATSLQVKTTTGSFSVSLTGLSPGTTYFFRPVASNSAGVTNGTVVNFATAAGGGGGGGFGSQLIGIGLSGISPFMDGNGRAVTAGQIATPDGKLSLSIHAGTAVWNAAGAAQGYLSASLLAAAPATPSQNILIAAYELGPSGVTLNPAISLNFGYTDSQIPPGTREADLVIAWWNGASWVKIPGVVDATNNNVTVQVDHVSVLALLAQVPTSTTAPPTTVLSTTTPPATTVPSTTAISVTSLAPATTAPANSVTLAAVTGANWILAGGVILVIIAGLFLITRKRS
jgi:hypothetical protein